MVKMRQCGNMAMWQCPVCRVTAMSSSLLVCHLSQAHHIAFLCYICLETFSNLSQWVRDSCSEVSYGRGLWIRSRFSFCLFYKKFVIKDERSSFIIDSVIYIVWVSQECHQYHSHPGPSPSPSCSGCHATGSPTVNPLKAPKVSPSITLTWVFTLSFI